MAASLFYNRIKYTAAAGGLVDFVTGASITGFRTPAGASIPDGTLVSYVAFSSDQSQWETGQGAYTVATTTVARTTVRESSNAGAKVNFTAAPTVALDLQAQDVALLAPLVSPSFTTPALGVAIGTSLALGGATIGTNALAVTGTASISSRLTVGSSNGAVQGVIIGNAASGYSALWETSVTPDTSNYFFLSGQGTTILNTSGTIEMRRNNAFLAAIDNVSMRYATTVAFGYADTLLSRNATGIIQFGTTAANAAGSWLATSAGLGPTPAISASTMLNLSAGTTAVSQIRLGASTAPTSPVDGDFWFDGTNFKARVSGATKTFTIT